jgi:hypothetical protein
VGNGIQTIASTPHVVSPFALFLGFLMLSLPLLIRWEAKKRFKKTPAAGNIISWTFTELDIENKTVGAQSRFEWSRLILIKQVKYGFLLYPQPKVAHWIPKHAFKSTADRKGFMALIKNSGVKYNNG